MSEITVHEDWIRFDFSNVLSFARTVPAYCCIDGNIIEGKSWAKILVAIAELGLNNKNPAIEKLYKIPLYGNRPFFLKSRIEGQTCFQLSNGYWIYVNCDIPALMKIIRAFLFYCGYNKDRVVLYGAPKEGWSSNCGRLSLKKIQELNFDMEKAEITIKEAGLHGVTVQKLTESVWSGATFSTAKNALDRNMNIIAMPDSRYVHAESFIDLNEAEDILGKILSTHFAQFCGYSNNQLLFGAASQELSLFLNDNDCKNIEAVYAIARYLFEKKAVTGKPYKFSSPHIFEIEPDCPITRKGLMIRLAKNNGGILHATDARDYLQKIMLSFEDMSNLLQIKTSNTFLMYDDERYLLSEALGIDDTWLCQMHDRMDDLFRKANVAYVIPRDISTTWLNILPALPQSLEWTRLLLQEVLDKYPAIGFKSISADINQSHHTLSAAFVPIDSPLQFFPDVVSLFMEERHKLPMRMSGEELRIELRDAGMLENNELIYALPKALDDYRFAWTDENKYVLIRGNR